MNSYPYTAASRRDVQRLLPSGIRSLLDVGCGSGEFGAELSAGRPGVEVWGIDPEPSVADAARQNLTQFVSGRFPDDLPPAMFDCITFNDSLEHFTDPWAVLTSARSLLSPNGSVVCSIPNVRNYAVIRNLLVGGKWEYRDTGILDRTHLRFFTRRSGVAMFEEVGFVVESVTPLNVASNGRMVRALALLGARTVEFRALQYAYVCRPR